MRTSTFVAFVVLVLVFSLWSVGVADEHQLQSGLVFEAQPVKTIYRTGEAVEFNFKLRNASQRKVVVARTFQLNYYVNLEITDQGGNRAAWCGRVISQIDSARSFAALPAGGTVGRKVTISCVGKDDPGRAWGYSLDNPGKYLIKATYGLPQPNKFFEKLFPGVFVARGPLAADAVTLEVH